MAPISGKVGTTATLTIVSNVFPVDGDYMIRWSSTSTFDEDKTVVLTKGNVPRGGYNVTARFTIPEAKYGIAYVQFRRIARDEPLNIQFNVKPGLTINPSPATPGTTVTINGTGFPANDTGTLTFDGKSTTVDIVTNKVGSFSAKYTVPDISTGAHKLVIDTPRLYTETATATLEVVTSINHSSNVPEDRDEVMIDTDRASNSSTTGPSQDNKPPKQPVILAPKGQRVGLLGTKPVTFSWTKVSDPSGITYTMEISDNIKFTPIKPGMRKSDLTQASSTVRIAPGTYYWRVKAIDGAGNESQWVYSPYAFKVGLVPPLILIVSGLIFLLIFILLVRAFSRRLNEYYY